MRKFLFMSVFALAYSLTLGNTAHAQVHTTPLKTGDLVKTANSPAVYILNGNTRAAFPNQRIFESYNLNFANVQTIPVATLEQYTKKGKVLSNQALIKSEVSPDVYLISQNDKIRLIENEDVASRLFGADWNQRITTVSAAKLAKYTKLSPITTASERITADNSPILNVYNKMDDQTVVDIAVGNGTFSTLVAAVSAADLVPALQAEGPFTVFAPTNDAFAKLPAGTVENLLKPENKQQLVDILTYHVVPGKVTAADVVGLSAATMLNEDTVSIKLKDGKVILNNASTVVQTDIMGSNGVIHVIDTVLLPPSN
jgi:uncharacterized surface protein with fasciclin (FAS1) repeats